MEGLIYKVQPYLEHSKLLFTYTKYGKVTLIAQGVQKVNSKERNIAQYLTLIEFDYKPRKSMYRLAGAKLLDDYSTLKQSFFKVKSAALIFELIDRLVLSDEDHGLIYQNAKKALEANVLISSLSFALKLLKPLGHRLNLIPDGKVISGFSLVKSSLVYKDELTTVDLNVKATLTLLQLVSAPYDQIDKIDDEMLTIIKKFVYNYYEYHLEIKLKTLE